MTVFGHAALGGRSLAPPTHRRADGSNSITAKIHVVAGYKAFIIPKVSNCRNKLKDSEINLSLIFPYGGSVCLPPNSSFLEYIWRRSAQNDVLLIL